MYLLVLCSTICLVLSERDVQQFIFPNPDNKEQKTIANYFSQIQSKNRTTNGK